MVDYRTVDLAKFWESGFTAMARNRSFQYRLDCYLKGVVVWRTVDWAKFEALDVVAEYTAVDGRRPSDRVVLAHWVGRLTEQEMDRAFANYHYCVDRYRLCGVVDGRKVDWAKFDEIDLEAEKAAAEREARRTAASERKRLSDQVVLAHWGNGLTEREMDRAFPNFQYRLAPYRLRGVVDGRKVDWAKFEVFDFEAEKAAGRAAEREAEREAAREAEEEQRARARVTEIERRAKQDYRRAVREGRDQKQAIEDYQRAVQAAMEQHPQAKRMLRFGPPPR